MKRFLVVVVAALLTMSAQLVVAQPTVRTISGNPLTVNVGSDASFQVYTTLVPGQGQFYPSSNTTVADYGVFVDRAGTLFAPAFSTRGTATGGIGANTPWTSVSISAVTGTGTPADPFTVVVINDAAATGLRMTMTVTYVNGENFFRKTLAFSSAAAQTFDVFLGGDIYLANSDNGVPYTASGAVGGQNCGVPTYTILMIPLTPANRYSARGYSTVWSEIGAGLLSNVIATGCQDNGAALQWQNQTIGAAGGSVQILAATSFGAIPPIVNPPPTQGPAQEIPTMSEWMLLLTAVLVALLGLRRMRSVRS